MIKFKAIRPGKFDATGFTRELERAVSDVGKQIERDFKKPTADWNHKPAFQTVSLSSTARIGVEVFTRDDIYAWVSQGTNGPGGSWYPIKPRRAARLAYQMYFRPKTSPGSLASNSGGKFGPYIFRKGVTHPGIVSPRQFDVLVAALALPVLVDKVEKALSSARRQSGHAI